jgi:hypothetical protein
MKKPISEFHLDELSGKAFTALYRTDEFGFRARRSKGAQLTRFWTSVLSFWKVIFGISPMILIASGGILCGRSAFSRALSSQLRILALKVTKNAWQLFSP